MTKRRLTAEVWIVLGLSLGQSAVYAIVSLVAALTRGPLHDATATLNANRSDREWLDATLQLLAIGFALVPVALAMLLLATDGRPLVRLGLDRVQPARDLLSGFGLALVIGVPGLGLYALGRMLGLNADVVPVPDHTYWWTIPVLLFVALENAVVEEVIAVGYLLTRLRDLRWGPWAAIAASAALRGTYHLYQGFGQAIGNAVMGAIFAWWFQRTGRLAPLIVAHALLDVVAFVGYLTLGDRLGLS
ncbi:MAG TPA: CPBP family intramembrane glutamic endopeptidase [Aeromicrobium sp.]|nr:CPBP family intramembrane glutamic endopeptidase [Aeromicrobium sp.]